MSDNTEATTRPLRKIAADVREDWKTLDTAGYAALPYVVAMERLDDINGMYYQDSARSVVQYFLGNATSWRGDKAREVKAELKAMLKLPRA